VASIATLMVGLFVSFFMELHILREVLRTGESLEHEDYKVRVEMQRMESMRKELEQQEVIIERLKSEFESLLEEKRDLHEMHAHQHHLKDTSFQNPLDADGDDDDDDDDDGGGGGDAGGATPAVVGVTLE